MATSREDALARGNFYAYGTGNIEDSLRRATQQQQSYLQQASELYEPYKKTGLSSLDEYTKLLLGGVDALSGDKNFQAMQDLAEKKVMANRATSGLLRSGATAGALDETLLNFANTYYSNRLDQLRGGTEYGTMAADSQASILDKMGGNVTDLASALANIKMQREANDITKRAAQQQANATLYAANEESKAAMTAGIIGGIGSLVGGLL